MEFLRIITIAVILVLSSSLNAATIVDTGLIPCNGSSCGGATLNYKHTSDDRWAARFSLTSDAVITDMQVWINTSWSIGSTFSMVIYGDGGTIPNASNQLFVQDVLVIDQTFEDNMENQWQGLSGMALNLGAGSYWLSLENRAGNDYEGYIPTGHYGALNSLDTYAFYNEYNGAWLEDPSSDFAFKIAGNVSTVPVPAALWLFVSGLFGVLGLSKRKTL